MKTAMEITGNQGYGFVFETAGQVATMHMAFELAANKAHVCFIGTPHENLTFTPAQWGEYEPEGIQAHRFLDVLQRPLSEKSGN